MKLLLLIRHAKSSWKDTRLDDHDRTLNKRGEHDAPFMATVLKKKHITTDLIITSTATRALLTAKIFAKELGYKKDHIIQDKGLYLAELEELIEIVKQLPDKILWFAYLAIIRELPASLIFYAMPASTMCPLVEFVQSAFHLTVGRR